MRKKRLPKEGKLKPNSWVVRTRNYEGYDSPFKVGGIYLFLSEIANSPGHGIFIKHLHSPKNNTVAAEVHVMYHLNDFRMATEDEV